MFITTLGLSLLAFSAHAEPTHTVPKAQLDYWNEPAWVYANNCYNYSTNRRTDSYAQPGEASGIHLYLSCEGVRNAAAKDLGLYETTYFPSTSIQDETLIALVIDPGTDFHWYRRDADGFWSHKMGSSPATTLDNDDIRIADPEKANRGDYVDFCGYFRIRNFIYGDTEQNGGYVRIGDMSSLPDLPSHPAPMNSSRFTNFESELEFLVFSGRPNPRVPFKELVGELALNEMIFKASKLVASTYLDAPESAQVKKDWETPRLGYRGAIFHDHDAKLLPQGSRLYFISDFGYVFEHKNQRHFVGDKGAAALSRALAAVVRN